MLSKFETLFRSFCNPLAVSTPTKISSFHLQLKETGTDLPRLILVHQFAILKMIWNYGDTVRSFVIIDSLKQNEQDPQNLRAMIDFIDKNFPQDQQLVLGLVDTQGVRFHGKELKLENQRKLLSEKAYDAVNSRIRPLLDKAYASLTRRQVETDSEPT